MSNPNPSPETRFKKGDPRIWKNGRPRTFDALRELAQQIAHEAVKDKSGEPVVVEGHAATVTEIILRKWAASNDPRLQMAFVEVAYGKTPSEINLHVDDKDIDAAIEAELARVAAKRQSADVGEVADGDA
jgi:hypothetical protein